MALCHDFVRRKFLFLNLDVVFLGQIAQGFGISEMLVFHKEFGGVASFATAEAFEDVACRIHIERWRLLVMERAAANEIRPAFFQGHKLTDNFLNASGLQYFFNFFPWNGHD